MPTYEIQKHGRTLEIEAPTAPTAQDIERAFAALQPRRPQAQPSMLRQGADMVADFATGAVKGAANTAIGLGQMVHRVPGVSTAVDALYGTPGLSEASFTAAREAVRPTTTAQQVGFAGEQIGEFFVPASTAAKVGRVADVAITAGKSLAQSGSLTDAGVSGAMTAAMPAVVGAVSATARGLKTGAHKAMAQALGATKEWAKSDAAKLAPEMLRRGVRGSQGAMLSRAEAVTQRLGAELDDAYRLAAESGEAVPGDIIRGHIQLAADALKVKNAAGTRVVIPGTEQAVKRLDELDEFIAGMGDDIPVDKAAHLKRTWDEIVSAAGLYGQKAGASATDSADAWALREAAGAFREILNTNPTIGALNKELSFWTGLKKVLTATELRTQAQSGGLVAAGSGGAGAVIGAMSGDSTSERTINAVLGGLAGRKLIQAAQSPQFRTAVVGPLKNTLADALARGNPDAIARAISRLAAATPSQVRNAGATR